MFKASSAYKFLIWPALIMGYFLSGCSSTSELFREEPVDETVNVNYSVIYYIHADSDYLYHDAAGEPVRGNSKVLDTALKVAEEAKSGEVFVIYQPPEKRFLGLFPRKKSQFYHFINGELTSHVKYRHSDKNEDFLTTEARLFNQYQTPFGKENRQNYFLYFGHEIPDDNGKKYHQTLPDITVNTRSVSAGIQKFLASDEDRYDLVVLSTCNNGTPVMADHLMPISDLLLASPQNLHLSHIDSKNLDLMESNPGISSVQIADSMAEHTFQRLETDIHTAITLTVYDFRRMQEHKNELHAFATAYNRLDDKKHFSDNIDCNQVGFFDDETFGKGIKTWYKPARFGRQSLTNTHSGLGCKPRTDSER